MVCEMMQVFRVGASPDVEDGAGIMGDMAQVGIGVGVGLIGMCRIESRCCRAGGRLSRLLEIRKGESATISLHALHEGHVGMSEAGWTGLSDVWQGGAGEMGWVVRLDVWHRGGRFEGFGCAGQADRLLDRTGIRWADAVMHVLEGAAGSQACRTVTLDGEVVPLRWRPG